MEKKHKTRKLRSKHAIPAYITEANKAMTYSTGT